MFLRVRTHVFAHAHVAPRARTRVCGRLHVQTHLSVTVDGVRLNAVRFVAVSPHLSSSYTKTFPIATFAPQS